MLVPDRPGVGGVVVHHQHASQWHFGKSEVAGHVGDPWQAFGPALARRGVTVLAPDALGFEDRRASAIGTEPRAADPFDYHATMCYRLLEGRPLMGAVLADATAAHSVLEHLLDGGRVGVAGHSMGGATALFHAQDAAAIARAAAGAYAATGASERLHHADFEGGHALTAERFDLIVDWLCCQLAAQ